MVTSSNMKSGTQERGTYFRKTLIWFYIRGTRIESE